MKGERPSCAISVRKYSQRWRKLIGSIQRIRFHEESDVPDIKSREVRLTSRPHGIPTAANFIVAETQLKPLGDQEVLVRNLFHVGGSLYARAHERGEIVCAAI